MADRRGLWNYNILEKVQGRKRKSCGSCSLTYVNRSHQFNLMEEFHMVNNVTAESMRLTWADA